MEHNKIYCQVDMFALQQHILLMSNGTVGQYAESSLPELGNALLKAAYETNSNEIAIYGQDSFLTQLVSKMKNNQTQNYQKNVRISVNGKVCN